VNTALRKAKGCASSAIAITFCVHLNYSNYVKSIIIMETGFKELNQAYEAEFQ
jgi:hypothetical protein